jgi:CBS domain-containing protein
MLSKYFVRDVMVRGIFEIRLNDSVLDAVKVMGKNDISSVVVSDDNGTYWGIITELDILKNHTNLDKVKAKEIMSSKITTISPMAPLERATQLMAEKKIHHLYVTSELDEDKIIGVISSSYIIKLMAEISEQ